MSLPAEIDQQLSAGESVLWTGRPRQGLVLRGADAFLIPFSLLWGGFAFFWEFSVVRGGAPAFFALWGVPFVLIGLYLIVGRFFFEARLRASTVYALTSERVLIVSGVFARRVRSLNLRTLAELSLNQGRGDEGTISFGGGSPFAAMFGGLPGWPGAGRHVGPQFELLADAKGVFEKIRSAQRAAG